VIQGFDRCAEQTGVADMRDLGDARPFCGYVRFINKLVAVRCAAEEGVEGTVQKQTASSSSRRP
jgi:hypothetical protein